MRFVVSFMGIATAGGFYAGLNLPPHQGSSQDGCYLPGVYNYSYSRTEVEHIRFFGFDSLRLPVNVDTALDLPSLTKLRDWVDIVGGRAIISMFGTALDRVGHGTGRVDDVAATSRAWASVHSVFAAYPDVRYELFNEPYGYPDNDTGADEFLAVMRQVIHDAKLPEDKCMLACAPLLPFVINSGPKALDRAGWKGDIAYHVYPIWLAPGNQTQEAFYNMVLDDIGGISNRIWITEFGAALDRDNTDYSKFDPSGNAADVNCLRGLHDALLHFKAVGMPVKGAFHWHGWRNGDSFDFFLPANANGRHKVQNILKDLSVKDIVMAWPTERYTTKLGPIAVGFTFLMLASAAASFRTARSRERHSEEYVAIKDSA